MAFCFLIPFVRPAAIISVPTWVLCLLNLSHAPWVYVDPSPLAFTPANRPWSHGIQYPGSRLHTWVDVYQLVSTAWKCHDGASTVSRVLGVNAIMKIVYKRMAAALIATHTHTPSKQTSILFLSFNYYRFNAYWLNTIMPRRAAVETINHW